MTIEQQQIRQWMQHGQQECPNVPTIPSKTIRELRLHLVASELEELAIAYGFRLEYQLYNVEWEPNLIEVADACADLKVVVIGTEVASGIDGEPIFAEVMRSNNTKLVKDGNGNLTVVKNHMGKIMKPSTYEPPNLAPIIQHQIENPIV